MARSLFAVLCLLAAPCAAFVATSLPRPAVVRRAAAPTALAFDPAAIQTIQLLAEILDEEGERVYGAVEAPLWVIPVGGLLAIGTALLPVCAAAPPRGL